MIEITKLYTNDVTELALALFDGPRDRRTERRAADAGQTTLTIAHSDSNENGKVPTQRSNVRVLTSKEIGDTELLAKAYAQLTLSVPKGIFTLADVQKLVAQLLNIVLVGDNTETAAAIDGATGLYLVPRLYAGEP